MFATFLVFLSARAASLTFSSIQASISRTVTSVSTSRSLPARHKAFKLVKHSPPKAKFCETNTDVSMNTARASSSLGIRHTALANSSHHNYPPSNLYMVGTVALLIFRISEKRTRRHDGRLGGLPRTTLYQGHLKWCEGVRCEGGHASLK